MRSETDICGIGAVTAYGWGKVHLWDGLLSGTPAASLVDGYGPAPDDAGWVGLVPDGGDPADGSLFTRAFLAAAREAIEDAIERGWRPGRRVGVIYGSALDDLRSWRDYQRLGTPVGVRRNFIAMMSSSPVMALMSEYGFHGPAMTAAAMCATGNAALITAKMWLDNNFADDVVVVTADLSGTREVVRDFVSVGVAVTDAPPADACRPFQEGSRGFTFAEGACAFVVTRQRTDRYAGVLGGHMTHEAFHPVALNPDPGHVVEAVAGALAAAEVDARDVRYFNAHGPGTRQCDTTEAAVLDRLFPETTGIYSFKPLTGHCQTAASLVEIAATCLSAQHDLLPVPKPVANGHPRLLDGPSRPQGGLTVKTSIGMGGYVTALVLDAA